MTDDPETKTPDNPFDGEAARYAEEDPRLSTNQARDIVIIRYLAVGDTRALAHFLELANYQPGEEVKKLLSFMLQPVRVKPTDPSATVEVPIKNVPYSLHAKSREGKRGRPRDLSADGRNRMIRDYYEQRLAESGPGTSEAVIMSMVEQLEGVTEGMVREAIKQRSPKSPKAG